EPVTLPPPGERSSTNLITANPMKGIVLNIRMILIPYIKGIIGRVKILGRHRVVFNLLNGIIQSVGELPGRGKGRGIIFNMHHVPASFYYQGLQSLFTEFLGRPAAADARANHNGVEA